MALSGSIRETGRKSLADRCIHCAAVRVYEPGEETGENAATGWRMRPEGEATGAPGS